MLGAGELLRELTITVGQLLDRSAKDIREWDEVLHKGLGTDTWQRLPYSQWMGTLYPRVHPLWSLSNGRRARAVIHRRRGSLALIA
jgi:hypothetical protein